jgi:hypothetical protein
MTYAIEMASCGMMYIPSFMRNGAGVQSVFRFWPSNLNGGNISVTDARDL